MAEGLSYPLQVNEVGGARTARQDNQLQKLIGLAFSEGENDNPFQLSDEEVGFSPPIFEINDVAAVGRIKLRAKRIMELLELQERAKLDTARGGIQIFNAVQENPFAPSDLELKESEVALVINYINLETQQPSQYVQTFG